MEKQSKPNASLTIQGTADSLGAMRRPHRVATLVFFLTVWLAPAADADAFGSPPTTKTTPHSGVLGRVELIPGVPSPQCKVEVPGTPRIGTCDQGGAFRIDALDAGRWTLATTVVVPQTGETLTRSVVVGTSPGEDTQLTITMSAPLTIGGVVGGIDARNSNNFFVLVADERLAARLTPSGTFLLAGLSPGRHRLALRTFSTNPIPPARNRVTEIDIDVRTGPMQLFAGLDLAPGGKPTNPLPTPPVTPPVTK